MLPFFPILLAAGFFNKLWFALPLIVAISLVYAASKHETWPLIARNAVQTGVWMIGFMSLVFLVLVILSWGL